MKEFYLPRVLPMWYRLLVSIKTGLRTRVNGSGIIFEKTVLEITALQVILTLCLSMAIAFALCQVSGVNVALFYAINHISEQYINHSLLAHIADLGNGALASSLAVCAVLRKPELFKRLVLTVICTAVVATLFKENIIAPRPATILDKTSFNIIGKTLRGHSFPSGHTMTVFALAGFYALSFKKGLLSWMFLLTAFVAGLSRISVGAHWPEDVFAGAALGLMCALLSAQLSMRSMTAKGSYLAALLLCGVIILGLVMDKNEFPEVPSIVFVRYVFAAFCAGLWLYFSVAYISSVRHFARLNNN